jgi:hypothetical protein
MEQFNKAQGVARVFAFHQQAEHKRRLRRCTYFFQGALS